VHKNDIKGKDSEKYVPEIVDMNIDKSYKTLRDVVEELNGKKLFKNVKIKEYIDVMKRRLKICKENGVIKAYIKDVLSDATRSLRDNNGNADWRELQPVNNEDFNFIIGNFVGAGADIDDDILMDDVEIEVEPEVFEGVDVSQYVSRYYNEHFTILELKNNEAAVYCGKNYFVHPLMGENKIIKMLKYNDNEQVTVNYRFDIENSRLLTGSNYQVQSGEYLLYENYENDDQINLIENIFDGLGIEDSKREVDFKNLKFRYLKIEFSEFNANDFVHGNIDTLEPFDGKNEGEKIVYYDIKKSLDSPWEEYESYDDIFNLINPVLGEEKMLFIIDNSGYFYYGTLSNLVIRQPGDSEFNYITSGKIMFVISNPVGINSFMVPTKKTVTGIHLSLQGMDGYYEFYPNGILDFDMLNDEYDDKILITKDLTGIEKLTQNGIHEVYASDEGVDGYDKVLIEVDVPSGSGDLETLDNKLIDENRNYSVFELMNDEGKDGITRESTFEVDVKPKLTSTEVTSSGNYTIENYNKDNNTNYDGFSSVNVSISGSNKKKNLVGVKWINENNQIEFIQFSEFEHISKENSIYIGEGQYEENEFIIVIVPEYNFTKIVIEKIYDGYGRGDEDFYYKRVICSVNSEDNGLFCDENEEPVLRIDTDMENNKIFLNNNNFEFKFE